MEIKGRVIANLGIQKGVSKTSGKEWAKSGLVVEIPGQYPKTVALDNMKDAERFHAIPIGSEGTFYIGLESREYNGRWYTNVNCWKWELASQSQQQPQQPQPQPAQQSWSRQLSAPSVTPSQSGGALNNDPLPF